MIAGVFGALGVLKGAFGAHWLPGYLDGIGLGGDEVANRVRTFEIGVRYQLYHALALLAVGTLAMRAATNYLTAAGIAFVLGIAIFSGLLYTIALTGIKILGAIVPLGGLSFIVGWIMLIFAARHCGEDL